MRCGADQSLTNHLHARGIAVVNAHELIDDIGDQNALGLLASILAEFGFLLNMTQCLGGFVWVA